MSILSDLRLRLIWSRTHLIPGLPVPHFLSPWTNGPQKFGPHGQMVPNQFGPPGKMVPRIFCLSRGQAVMIESMGTKLVGDHLSRGTKFFGTICPEQPNFFGTICPWGPNLMGTVCPGRSILWGSFVQGNRKSGDQMGSGPNAFQPYFPWSPTIMV